MLLWIILSLFVQGCPPGKKEYGPARGQPLRDVETPHQDRGRRGQGYYAQRTGHWRSYKKNLIFCRIEHIFYNVNSDSKFSDYSLIRWF